VLLAIIFTVGAILVTWLLFTALRPSSIEIEGETADLRFVGYALVLIVLTAVTVAAMLILGKIT
jgi:hypothetical protein